MPLFSKMKIHPLPAETIEQGQPEVRKAKKEKRILTALLRPFRRVRSFLVKQKSKSSFNTSSSAGCSMDFDNGKTQPDFSYNVICAEPPCVRTSSDIPEKDPDLTSVKSFSTFSSNVSISTEEMIEQELTMMSLESESTEKDQHLMSLESSSFSSLFNDEEMTNTEVTFTPVRKVKITLEHLPPPILSRLSPSVPADFDPRPAPSLKPFQYMHLPGVPSTRLPPITARVRSLRPKTSHGNRPTPAGWYIRPANFHPR